MSEKTLLAISGGPHTHGTTAAMLDCAVHAAEQSGFQVTKVNLYEKQIALCKGCRTCIHTGSCVQRDDIAEITSLIKRCDVIILAAPVYWANVPAAVKNMFDRLLGAAMEETSTFPKPRLPGKRYILLTACNTPFPFSWIFGQSRGAIRSMDEFFKTAGMKCMGKFVCSGSSRTSGKNVLPKSLTGRIERCFK